MSFLKTKSVCGVTNEFLNGRMKLIYKFLIPYMQMIKTFTVTLPVQERAPCNSYFTVWDNRTRDRGTITFKKKFENADLKILLCTGCHNEIGEVDAWYGVKCSCGDLVVPGYQILKVVFPPSFVPNLWLVSRQLSFTVNLFRDLVS